MFLQAPRGKVRQEHAALLEEACQQQVLTQQALVSAQAMSAEQKCDNR